MKSVISATEARNNFFEMLNSVIYKGEEFIVEKDGKPAVKVSSAVVARDPKEIEKTLKEIREVFKRSAKRKYWSVIDTPAWKRKESRYLKRLSEGIVD
jgi:prevent-host-death family protein